MRHGSFCLLPIYCQTSTSAGQLFRILCSDKFLRMADTGKDYISNSADPKNVQDLTTFVQNLLQQMQDKFQGMSDQIITRIDEMGNRIDDLEKNIADLMTQAGVDERA